jgi:hypothetical protein
MTKKCLEQAGAISQLIDQGPSTGRSTAWSLSWALMDKKAPGMGWFLPGRWGRALAGCVALLLALALPSWAADDDDFYRGNTITIIIPIGPGGAYDAYARLVSRHLGKQLPAIP